MIVLRLLGVVALAAVLASCSVADSTGSSETTATFAPLAPLPPVPAADTTSSVPTTPSVPTTSPTPTSSASPAPSVATASSAISVDDVVAYLGEFSKAWNENNLRWITALSDPTKAYDDFLVVQQEVGADQGDLLADLDLWIGTLDPDWREALEPLVETYHNRYRHMVDELFPATLGADHDAFQAALQEHESQNLPEYSEEAVRSFVAHPVVASALEADGVDPDEMVDSLVGTLAGT